MTNFSQLPLYIGRTVDVSAYDPQDGIGVGFRPVAMQLASGQHGGKVTTGIQKLSQRFLLRLLTARGSMRHLPSEGTDFLTEARAGGWRSPADVFASFARAASDIQEQMLAEELPSDPDDERLDEAELLSVELAGDRASLVIKLTTAAGTSRTFIEPLPVTI